MKESLMVGRIFFTLFRIVPYFAGLFVIRAKPAPLYLDSYFKRYLLFLIVFLLWSVLRIVLERTFWSAREKITRSRSLLNFGSSALAAFAFITALTVFHRNFENQAVTLVVTAILLDGVSFRFQRGDRKAFSIVCSFVRFSIIGFLSFQIVFFKWEWQPILFAAALAAPLAVLEIAFLLRSEGDAEQRTVSKLLPFFTVLGPLLIGSLSFLGALNASYSMVYLAFLPALPLLMHAKSPPESLPRKAIFFSLFFVVILGALDILSVG